jgi:sporulation protein YlmC with PRC-barrel domain
MNMNYEDRDTFGMYKTTEGGGAGPDARRGPGPEMMGAETLVGNDVYNQSDEDLGDIKEIMLDMRSGKVGYAVLSFGGFLGMGEKLFAVPWNALVLDTKNKRFVLNVDKERLKDAPGFNRDQWPNMADQSWAKQIHSYYGTKPHLDAPMPFASRR